MGALRVENFRPFPRGLTLTHFASRDHHQRSRNCPFFEAASDFYLIHVFVVVSTTVTLQRRAKRQEVQNKYDAIQGELSALQARLADAEQRLIQTKAKMSPFEPIQDLPDNILRIIFEMAFAHCFPHCTRYQLSRRYRDAGNSPLILTHVCRHWRHIALSCPSLWSCLHVTFDDPEESCEKELPMLELFLARSGRRKLSIMVHCHHQGFGVSKNWSKFEVNGWPTLKACLNALLREHDRWQHFMISASYPQVMTWTQDSLMERRHFPVLEYLQLCADKEDEHSNIQHAREGFTLDAPALVHYRTERIPALSPPTFYDRMVELKLYGLSADRDALMDTMRHAASTLRRLTMCQVETTYKDSNPSNTSPSPVHFPRLEQLVLSHCEANELLKSLLRNSPTLESFVYKGGPELRNLLPRSSVPLGGVRAATFSLTSHPESSWPKEAEIQLWRAFATAFCSLRKLELNERAAPGCLAVLRALTAQSTSPDTAPLPHLRTLAAAVESAESVRRLLPALAIRSKAGYPIETVRFVHSWWFGKTQPDIEEKLGAEELQGVPGTKFVFLERRVYRFYSDSWADAPLHTWDFDSDGPEFLPWNGSMDFWYQF